MAASSLRPAHRDRPDFHSCSGCGLCLLPCPVWHEKRDFSFTLAGRAKALQGGAPVESIASSALACVLCGACEVVCPEGIDTVGFNLDVREQLARSGRATMPGAEGDGERGATPAPAGVEQAREIVLIAGRALASDGALLTKVVRHLGGEARVRVSRDDGHEETVALERGTGAGAALDALLASCKGAREIVAAEGLLHRPLRAALGGRPVVGLGEVLLRSAALRGALGPDDLYVIESRTYHADFERLVRFYDSLRQERGCSTNLDLHRAALATGRTSLQSRRGSPSIDAVAQARWIAEGRRIRRVVVEALEDREAFQAALDVPVLHLGEIA